MFSFRISSRDLQLLYCLADGCAHLEESDIRSGVNSIVSDSTVAKNIVQAIMKNRAEILHLVVAKRHPVILILDDVSAVTFCHFIIYVIDLKTSFFLGNTIHLCIFI